MALHYNSPTLTLVVNPAAGGGLARRQLPHVTSELVAGMPEASLQVIQTSSFAEARLRCIAAVEQAHGLDRALFDGIRHRMAAVKDALNAWADGMRQLQAVDVAEAILFCVTRPAHVSINEVLMRPTDQER